VLLAVAKQMHNEPVDSKRSVHERREGWTNSTSAGAFLSKEASRTICQQGANRQRVQREEPAAPCWFARW